MILDEDILFVTTSPKSKWLNYSSRLISKFFPISEHIHVDGIGNWPLKWFEWLKYIRSKTQKYVVHIDDDCFLTNREELLNLVNFLDNNNYTICGTSDAYSYYRRYNPVAINSFLMVVNRNHLCDLNIDVDKLIVWYKDNEYKNSFNTYWKEIYKEDFNYKYEKIGPVNYSEYEPYYFIFWLLKEKHRKFFYLYPEFDEYYRSINPKFDKFSKELAIHMWYSREWDSEIEIGELSNKQRYARIEIKINEILS